MRPPLLFPKISVIGLGYIGLPTAAMFASRKIEVVGVDVNRQTVETINQGKIHIVEPDLDIVVHAAVAEGYLRAQTTPEAADAFLIAVPTPFIGNQHSPDLSFIEAASRSIAPVLKPGNLIILESTSPVGTTEKMATWLATSRPDLSFPQTHGAESDIRIAHCPERVLPGKVMQELISNDRIIGGMSERCSQEASALYKTFVNGDCFITNARTAEMAKLTENSFRDVNIAFANELSMVCGELGIDVWELIQLANRHPRVNILQPGPGVGGHCIAVDPWFIVSSAPEKSPLIRTARQVNDAKTQWVIKAARDLVSQFHETSPSKVRIGIYGLTFKPNIDDLRESPAVDIANAMAELPSVELLVVEPNISELPDALSNAKLVTFEQATAADIHLMLVDHEEFLNTIKPSTFVIDARGVWKN